MFGCCSGDVIPILESVLELVQEEFDGEVRGEGDVHELLLQCFVLPLQGTHCC